eukprot:364362-Chlamydomonas_euryale.AAC.24
MHAWKADTADAHHGTVSRWATRRDCHVICEPQQPRAFFDPPCAVLRLAIHHHAHANRQQGAVHASNGLANPPAARAQRDASVLAHCHNGRALIRDDDRAVLDLLARQLRDILDLRLWRHRKLADGALVDRRGLRHMHAAGHPHGRPAHKPSRLHRSHHLGCLELRHLLRLNPDHLLLLP